MNIAINILFLLLLTSWAIKKPTKFVIGYFIYVTAYLGFFSRDILVANIEFGTFISNLIPLFCAVMYRNKLKDKTSIYIVIALLLFYVYGLFKPVIDGRQNIIMSVISSKAHTFYFFVIYVITLKDSIDFKKVFNFIFYTSIYYSALYIINGFGIGIRPPVFIKGDGIQCCFDSFMTFSLFYLHSQLCHIKKKAIYTVILIIGIYLGDFFSLISTSIILLPFLSILIKNWKNKANIIIFAAIIAVPIFIAFSFFQESQTYKEITANQSNAIETRSAHNEFRWHLIDKEYNWGYGFIHKDSHFLSFFTNSDSQYMNSLSFIDSGYTDLMGKFGLYGTILFLLIPLYFIKQGFKNSSNAFCIIFIIQMFAVNITWSVFTYQMGIILLALAYSYILRNNNSKFAITKGLKDNQSIVAHKELNTYNYGK